MLIGILCFAGGLFFGVAITACMVVASDADDAMEKDRK